MSEVKVKDPAAFAKAFLERYLGNGFGTMQKREIDVLVFHLISDIPQIKGQSNYEIANFLKVTESRVKSLRLDAGLRYQPANHKAVLGKVVMNIVDRMKKPDFEGGYLSVTLEDPVEKRELEHAVKQSGQQVEYGNNREILKIRPHVLLAVIVDNIEHGEREFVKLVKAHIADAEKQAKILDKALTLRQKLNKVGEELSDKSGLLSLILGAAASL